MTLALPRVVQQPTPNYTPTLICHDLLILHMMEGGYAGSVAWLCRMAVKASAHLCMSEDGSEVSQLVPLSMKAWAECNFNGRGISLELPGITAQGIPDERWDAAARIFGWLCVAYSIPPVWAKNGEGRGLCQHHDLGAAGGGHVDCSGVGSTAWLAFVARVAFWRDEFAKLPTLPEFALHGLPNPHQVQLPPNVPPTPTHGGAARVDPAEVVAPHPTASGYPDGSVADLQWRLIKAGFSCGPDGVDGEGGPDTRAALIAFQKAHGLATTGLGPITWGVLKQATGS